MKNSEIIKKAALENNIFSFEEIQFFEENNEELPLHTLNGWRNILGQDARIKKHEKKAGLNVNLWKRRNDGKTFYLCKSTLFTIEQIEIG